MTSSDSDRVCDLFARISRDVTPESARHAVHLLYAPFAPDSGISRCCTAVLSDSERQRADRFAREFEQDSFLQRRAFRRFCAVTALGLSLSLSQVPFTETLNGKPCLAGSPDYWFSFSSSRSGFLGAWSSTHAVGVDLEDPARKLDTAELARRFYSPAEAAAVERAGIAERMKTFVQFWSLKESALKSIGEGIPYGLDAFEFELGPNPRMVRAPAEHGGADRFRSCLVGGTDGSAALVFRELA